MNLYTIIGLLGFATYLTSYALLQLRRIDGNGVLYTALNMAAAAAVLVSLIEDFNLASAMIQVTWIGFGVAGLAMRAKHRAGDDVPQTSDAVEVAPVRRLAA